MAFVVSRPAGRWELRRSKATALGPRSTTLASFKELTEQVIERAVERSGGDVTPGEVRAAAHRAGAPISEDPIRVAASSLIRELWRGGALPAGWTEPLVGLLAGHDRDGGQTEAIAEWAGASAERRGRALWDLLLLADAIPATKRRGRLTFPGLSMGGR